MAVNGSYVVRETTANLTRNLTLTLASVLTVFVSLAIVGTRCSSDRALRT